MEQSVWVPVIIRMKIQSNLRKSWNISVQQVVNGPTAVSSRLCRFCVEHNEPPFIPSELGTKDLVSPSASFFVTESSRPAHYAQSMI